MIEIVFGDSACGSLKIAQNYGKGSYLGGCTSIVMIDPEGGAVSEEELEAAKREIMEQERAKLEEAVPMGGDPRDVFGFALQLSIGDISKKDFYEKREKVINNLYSIYPGDDAFEFTEKAKQALDTIFKKLESGESIRLWYSSMPDELCGLYWFMDCLTKNCSEPAEIFTVKMPDYEILENEVQEKLGWGEVEPGKWHSYTKLAQQVPWVFCKSCAHRWQELQEENAPLRCVLNGRLISAQWDIYDSYIQREIEAQPSEFNEAMVIGRVMGKYKLGIGDSFIAKRIQSFIDGGQLIAVSKAKKDDPSYHRILMKNIKLPPMVESRARAAGKDGEQWLNNLTKLVSSLEKKWNITVGAALEGGTHAFAAYAEGENDKHYVLKVDMPSSLGHADFSSSIEALKAADGQGYARLYAVDEAAKACLLERLGRPLIELNLPVKEQIKIICETLKKSWQLPIENSALQDCSGAIAWFREFIKPTWNEMGMPCSPSVINKAYDYLDIREKSYNPKNNVLVHGDAHNANTLEDLQEAGSFKMVDPDGCLYEKAADLGVLMREWYEEYRENPLENGLIRLEYIHKLTGESKQAIWQWGFLQTVSTALLLIKLNRQELGMEMLKTAEAWQNTAM